MTKEEILALIATSLAILEKKIDEKLKGIEDKFVGLLGEIKEHKSAGKHGPHSVFLCPVCEEPARVLMEAEKWTFTCGKCGGIAFEIPVKCIRKGDPMKYLEHGKEESLFTMFGTKELDYALGDTSEKRKEVVLAQVKKDKADYDRAQAKDGDHLKESRTRQRKSRGTFKPDGADTDKE